MHFLFVLYIGFDKHGPSVHLLSDIIEQCLIKGHRVTMIVRNRGGERPDVPEALVKYKNLDCVVIHDSVLQKNALIKRYFEDIWYAFRCCQIYKEYKEIDAVFLQSCTTPYFPIKLLKKTLKCPILFNVQNIFPLDALALNKLSIHGIKGIAFKIFRKMQQIAYRNADYIVTISEDMRQTLSREHVPSEKLSVVYNWSYSDKSFNIKDKDNFFLKKCDIDPALFRVVFAGNLGAMVNVRLIAGVAEICQKEPLIHFFIIGDGNNLPLLKRIVEEKHLKNISFYPYQPVEFAPHNYSMAHVNINALPKGIIYTCMPSKTATMLNCARPMIISVEKESAYAKLLSQVDKCNIVDIDDVESFADIILKNYYSGQKESSSNAYDFFITHFSKSNSLCYCELLEKLCKERNV